MKKMSLVRPTDGETISNHKMGHTVFEKNLTAILWSDNAPLIIGIFGSRGTGKTQFAKQWVKSLNKNKRVIYFSAWDYDDQTDPLQAIINEMRKSFPEKDINEVVKSAGNFLSLLIGAPLQAIAFSADIYSISKFGHALGLLALVNPIVSGVRKFFNSKKDPLSVQEKIDNAKDIFRQKLKGLAAMYENIVVVIDELDRCRPDFALQTLERIKHFFQIPGLKFVIISNEQQLYNSFIHEYGGNVKVDAPEYFRRFFDYGLNFPEPTIHAFVKHTLSRLKIDNNLLNHEDVYKSIEDIRIGLELSLRDIEQTLAIAKFGRQMVDSVDLNNDHSAVYLMLLIAALKATNKEKQIIYLQKSKPDRYSSIFGDGYSSPQPWHDIWTHFTRDAFNKRKEPLAVGLFELNDGVPPKLSFPLQNTFESYSEKTPLQRWGYLKRYILAIMNLHTFDNQNGKS